MAHREWVPESGRGSGGRRRRVGRALECRAVAARARRSRPSTATYIAASFGRTDILEWLRKHGCPLTEGKPIKVEQLLHSAIEFGVLSTVQWLVAHLPTWDPLACLSLALQHDHDEIVEWILSKHLLPTLRGANRYFRFLRLGQSIKAICESEKPLHDPVANLSVRLAAASRRQIGERAGGDCEWFRLHGAVRSVVGGFSFFSCFSLQKLVSRRIEHLCARRWRATKSTPSMSDVVTRYVRGTRCAAGSNIVAGCSSIGVLCREQVQGRTDSASVTCSNWRSRMHRVCIELDRYCYVRIYDAEFDQYFGYADGQHWATQHWAPQPEELAKYPIDRREKLSLITDGHEHADLVSRNLSSILRAPTLRGRQPHFSQYTRPPPTYKSESTAAMKRLSISGVGLARADECDAPSPRRPRSVPLPLRDAAAATRSASAHTLPAHCNPLSNEHGRPAIQVAATA